MRAERPHAVADKEEVEEEPLVAIRARKVPEVVPVSFRTSQPAASIVQAHGTYSSHMGTEPHGFHS